MEGLQLPHGLLTIITWDFGVEGLDRSNWACGQSPSSSKPDDSGPSMGLNHTEDLDLLN